MSMAMALIQLLGCAQDEGLTNYANSCLVEDVKSQYEFPDNPINIPTTVHRFKGTDFAAADYPLSGTDFSPEGTVARQFYDLQQYISPHFQIDVVDDQIHDMGDQETLDEMLDTFSVRLQSNGRALTSYWESLEMDNPDTIDIVYLDRTAETPSASQLNSGALFMVSDSPSFVAHEFGHGVFGLPHTFETEISAENGEYVVENDGLERVDGSNATYAGDWQSDTPADFPGSEKQCNVNDSDPDNVLMDCTFIDDPNGQKYTPDPRLIMSYFPDRFDINNLYFSDGELQTGLCDVVSHSFGE